MSPGLLSSTGVHTTMTYATCFSTVASTLVPCTSGTSWRRLWCWNTMTSEYRSTLMSLQLCVLFRQGLITWWCNCHITVAHESIVVIICSVTYWLLKLYPADAVILFRSTTHDLAVLCPHIFHGLTVLCPHIFHGLTVLCPHIFNGLTVLCPHIFNGLTVLCPHIFPGLTVLCPHIFNGLTVLCPHIFHGLTVLCPLFSMA